MEKLNQQRADKRQGASPPGGAVPTPDSYAAAAAAARQNPYGQANPQRHL